MDEIIKKLTEIEKKLVSLHKYEEANVIYNLIDKLSKKEDDASMNTVQYKGYKDEKGKWW